jgi:hypothetical protein
MTARDEEQQHHIDAAVREHVRRLKAFCDPAFIGDFTLFAEAYLNWLRDHGWRVIPKPPDWRTQRDQRPAEPNEAWKDAKAKITKTRGETDALPS